MKCRKLLIVIILVVVFSSGLYSKEVFKYSDIFKYCSVSNLKYSPDGDFVVFEKRCADKKENMWITHIYYASSDFKTIVKLTREGSNFSPQISPDSRRIAFLSTRDKKTQIYMIELPGGDPEKVTDHPLGVNGFRWINSKEIVFSAREKKGFIERKREKEKDDAIDVESIEEFYPVRLFKVSIDEKKCKRITKNRTRISEFEVSPSGNLIITSEIDSPKYTVDARYYKKYYIYDLSSGRRKQIFKKDRYFQPYSFLWANNNVILMKENKSNYEEKRGPGYPLLYAFFVKENRIKRIELGWEWGLGGFYSKSVYFGKNFILTMLAKGVWNYPVILKVDKNFNVKKRTIIRQYPYKNIDIFTLSPDGKKILFIASQMDKPHVFYSAKISKKGFKNLKKLWNPNPWVEEKIFGKREILRWKVDGREIEGILVFPAKYQPSKKYPLVLTFHGGPYAYTKDSFSNSWAYYPQALSGDGFFVLFVNYSGSSNYGLEFGESIVGKYYELEVPEILAGYDYVLKNYPVDKDNVGVMGWSNGAILTIATILERNFSFAIPGAGDVNWISDWGTCKFGVQFDNLYFGKPYYEDLELYIKKSPLFKLKKVKTPVLIFFGDRDTNVPTGQGWEFYRTMEQLGKEVKFILMPGEAHVFRKLSHQKRKVKEEIKWIHSHIKTKKLKEEFALLKKGSRIEILLKRDLKTDKLGRYGIIKNGILIPEFIKVMGIEVSRTELTVAQFNEFLKVKHKDMVIKSENPNMPVWGIDRYLIDEYIEFLKKKAGLKVRLIKESEFKRLLKREKVKKSNTLSYWIGYKPIPEEIHKWKIYIKKKKLGSSMIMPAGSFMSSESGIYDLSGNLPELTEEGKVLGEWFLSCDNEKEKKKWAGIRLVLEE